MRRRRTVFRPVRPAPSLVAGAAVARDPVLHRRHADASPGRGLATRQPLLQTQRHQLMRCQPGSHLRLLRIRAETSESRDLWKDHNSLSQPGQHYLTFGSSRGTSPRRAFGAQLVIENDVLATMPATCTYCGHRPGLAVRTLDLEHPSGVGTDAPLAPSCAGPARSARWRPWPRASPPARPSPCSSRRPARSRSGCSCRSPCRRCRRGSAP